MQGEIHKPDKIDGREIVVRFSFLLLLLDGESGVEDSSLIEVLLWSKLHLHDESGSVLVGTFDIDLDILLFGERINMFVVGVSEFDDVMLREEFLKEEQEKPFPGFGTEGTFEPIVEDDAGISPEGSSGFHKQWGYGPFRKRRPVRKSSLQVPCHKDRPLQTYIGRPIPTRGRERVLMILSRIICF